jgi:NAD(P)H-flavin reductase
MNTPAYQSATVLKNILIGDHVRHLTVELQEKIPHEPGQFFMLRLKCPSGEYVERSYSVASFSTTKQLEFVVRIEPHGQMSSLINHLEAGDQFDLKGPFGRFGFLSLPEKCQKLVLIAGGVGISPLRGVIQKSLTTKTSYDLQLFYGFRNIADFLFREELEAYAKDQRLTIVASVSEKTTTPWYGKDGYITEHLTPTIGEPVTGTQCFICGPPAMVKSTREKLFTLGFQRGQVHVEAW